MTHLYRIWRYSKNYWKVLAISLISAAFYGIVAAIPTYIIRYTIDDIFIKKYHHLIIPFILLFLVFFLLKGFFMYLTSYAMNWVGNQVINDIRCDLFKKIIFFPLSFFKETPTGHLISLFVNDIQMIQQAASSAIKDGIRSIFESIFLIGVAFYQNWQLAILMFIIGPIMGWTMRKIGSAIKRASRTVQQDIGTISSLLQEVGTGIREIKAFNGEHEEISRLSAILTTYFKSAMRYVHLNALLPSCIELVAMAGGGIIFYVATYQVINGQITAGQLASFIAAVLLVYQPLKKIMVVIGDIHYGLGAAEKVFAIMDRTFPALQQRTEELTSFEHTLQFNNLSFWYQSSSAILHDVTLIIPKGSCIGLVGQSGAGKSTLCDLLLGFIEPTAGSITIDGKSIAHLTLESLRKHIGYVGQRTFLFNDTIKNNIAYAQHNVSFEAIKEAAKAAHAHEFIEKLPQGYDTVVGENGILLSGGQKQRITIARALLKNPDILIFDEATSALDHESEAMIQETLIALQGKKTLLISTHRPSFIKHADKIFLVQQGTITSVHTSQESNFEAWIS